MPMMKAAVFVEPGRIVLDEKPIPDVGPLDALMRDHHDDDLRHRRPYPEGRVSGRARPDHRPRAGRRDREARLGGQGLPGRPARHRRRDHAERPQQCLPVRLPARRTAPARSTASRRWAAGRFGNTIDGCQAEYVLVPDAMANLAPIPDELTDEQVLMCPDIMSTGFGGAESGEIRIGDTVAVFAQGPIGLCATAGAQAHAARRRSSRSTGCRSGWTCRAALGADHVVDFKQGRPGRGDHAADRRPRRRRRDRGAGHAGDIRVRAARAAAGRHAVEPRRLFDRSARSRWAPSRPASATRRIVTTLCPGGKERMRRLMAADRLGPRRPAKRW